MTTRVHRRPSFGKLVSSGSSGFSRVDLLVTFTLATLLMIVAVGMTSRENSGRAVCQNNLRQLGLAVLEYAEESGDKIPMRRNSWWPAQLQPYYRHTRILLCPADGPNPMTFGLGLTNADSAPRSYLLNGFNDYYHGIPTNGAALPLSAIAEPAQTIVFGEKNTQSGHFWADYWAGDDYTELELGRHFQRSSVSSGASNHAFADGSVRLLPFGSALMPVNLWAVIPEYRTNSFIYQP